MLRVHAAGVNALDLGPQRRLHASTSPAPRGPAPGKDRIRRVEHTDRPGPPWRRSGASWQFSQVRVHRWLLPPEQE